MEKHKQKEENMFRLPERLVTTVDLMRTVRELKTLDDWLNQASIRSGGQKVTPPKTSTTLEEVASLNNVSLLEADHRTGLLQMLESFAINAPRIHMSFAVEPSASFLNKMIIWLRANVNPIIFMEIGLQPALAAGCTVRTTNKLFDMSLRNRFLDSRHFLVEAIEEAEGLDKKPNDIQATQSTATEPKADQATAPTADSNQLPPKQSVPQATVTTTVEQPVPAQQPQTTPAVTEKVEVKTS